MRFRNESSFEPLTLPKRLKALVLVNIPSHAAGRNLWGAYKSRESMRIPLVVGRGRRPSGKTTSTMSFLLSLEAAPHLNFRALDSGMARYLPALVVTGVPQSFSDGLIEVVGFHSAAHFGTYLACNPLCSIPATGSTRLCQVAGSAQHACGMPRHLVVQ